MLRRNGPVIKSVESVLRPGNFRDCCFLHIIWSGPVRCSDGPYALPCCQVTYITRRPASADRTARAANFRRDLEVTEDFN